MEGHNQMHEEEPVGLQQALNLPVDQAAVRKGLKLVPCNAPQSRCSAKHHSVITSQKERGGLGLVSLYEREDTEMPITCPRSHGNKMVEQERFGQVTPSSLDLLSAWCCL